jgi:alkylation response protein AidB-like acyl-CoA dehydrogenase
MNFNLSDEQQQIADSLERLLNDHYGFEKRRAIAAGADGWSPAVWQHLGDMGITAIGIPEAFGGVGGGAVDRLPVLQAFGRALVLEPYLASAVLAGTAVWHAASAAQKDAWLPRLASGDLRLAWAHEEAEGRSDAACVSVRARREGDRWTLNGSKMLVLHGAAAQRIVVSARIEGEPGHPHGLALFMVDPQGAGIGLRSYRLIDDSPAAELRLDNATAEPLGDPNDGEAALAAIRATLAAGAAAACADMVGAMESAFALTTAYVNTRKQFGRAIGEYQALRHRVAEMNVGLEMARSMAIAAAMAVDAPDAADSTLDLHRAKLVIGRHARALCHAAIQSHGGIGMTEEYAVGHCLRRVHVMEQLFGDADWQAARLAELEA